MGIRLGIDIGGTFTDLVAYNEETKTITNIKVPSTPLHPETGFLNSILQYISTDNSKSPIIKQIIHATTLGTNALIGQTGLELPKTGLLTTCGFRDILEIGRQKRPELYNVFVDRPKPLVPRENRLEVHERIDFTGKITKPLTINEIKGAAKKFQQSKIQALAISFLHSYIKPQHEITAKKILKKILKNVYISTSSEVLPEYREYERTSTTVINVLLMPLFARYIRTINSHLKRRNIHENVYFMQSNGGIIKTENSIKTPALLIESGPTAGVIAANVYANLLGIENVISFDMGGTTTKAGLIWKGESSVITDYEVGGFVHHGRVVRGSGYPVKFPFVDLAEIGAGGGSIAWIDEEKGLHVGPKSAGAQPGPVCYKMGGVNPTVTDSNLVLGRLNPKTFLGGEIPIYKKLAEKAIEKQIANPLNMNLFKASEGILEIVNSNMSRLLRMITVERGYDPRDFSLIAFGGAGPLHIGRLMKELNIPQAIIPPSPGLASALGLLMADFIHDFIITFLVDTDHAQQQLERIERKFQSLEKKALQTITREGIKEKNIIYRYLDMRYKGQAYELKIPILNTSFTKQVLTDAIKKFYLAHERNYGYYVEEETIEIVNLKIRIIGQTQKPKFKKYHPQHQVIKPKEKRKVWFPNKEFITTPIYDRPKIPVGFSFNGPAIIEEFDSTIIVEPYLQAIVDPYQNIILEIV